MVVVIKAMVLSMLLFSCGNSDTPPDNTNATEPFSTIIPFTEWESLVEEVEELKERAKECVIGVDPTLTDNGKHRIWVRGYVRNCLKLRPEQAECIRNWQVKK